MPHTFPFALEAQLAVKVWGMLNAHKKTARPGYYSGWALLIGLSNWGHIKRKWPVNAVVKKIRGHPLSGSPP